MHCTGSEAHYLLGPIFHKYSIKLHFFYNYTHSGNWHTRLMIRHKHHHHHQKAIMFIHSLHAITSLTITPISHLALAINKRKLQRGFNHGRTSSCVCRNQWGRAAIRCCVHSSHTWTTLLLLVLLLREELHSDRSVGDDSFMQRCAVRKKVTPLPQQF